MPFDIYALIKLLGDTHGLLGGKVQYLGSLLLQGTGGKRNRRFLAAFSVLYIFHYIILALQSSQDLIQLFFFMNGNLFIPGTVKFRV